MQLKYLLKEAEEMGLDITAEVKMCETDPPTPQQVIIAGTVSPYKKQVLAKMISDDLGISRENQRWM